MNTVKKDCRVNRKELDNVCCDCADFLDWSNFPRCKCEDCAVNRLKDRIGH